MSHFTVMVIKRKGMPEEIEDILAPYDEELKVAPYIGKTRAEIAEEGREAIKNFEDLDSRKGVQNYRADPIAFEAERGASEAEYYRKLIAFVEDYRTREWTDEDYYAFCTHVYYEPEELDAEGNYISTYNPNSKWDWYVEGGRWPDQLKLKDGSKADRALAKDVDWDAMFSLSKDLEEYYTKFWHAYVLDEMSTDPTLKEWYDEFVQFTFYKKEYFLEKYKDLPTYLRYCAQWTTYAVVDRKGWCAPGEMGWFGCSTESADESNEWSDKFRSRFVDTLDPEDEVVIVDCHI